MEPFSSPILAGAGDTRISPDILRKGMYHTLFPLGLETSPGLSEVYELALAYYESKILTKKELIKNSAYFVKFEFF